MTESGTRVRQNNDGIGNRKGERSRKVTILSYTLIPGMSGNGQRITTVNAGRIQKSGEIIHRQKITAANRAGTRSRTEGATIRRQGNKLKIMEAKVLEEIRRPRRGHPTVANVEIGCGMRVIFRTSRRVNANEGISNLSGKMKVRRMELTIRAGEIGVHPKTCGIGRDTRSIFLMTGQSGLGKGDNSRVIGPLTMKGSAGLEDSRKHTNKFARMNLHGKAGHPGGLTGKGDGREGGLPMRMKIQLLERCARWTGRIGEINRQTGRRSYRHRGRRLGQLGGVLRPAGHGAVEQ